MTTLRVPDGLIGAILGGRCVASVGARFAGDAVLDWRSLLQRLAEDQGAPFAGRKLILVN